MWVRAKPEAERVQLSIIDWHERQAVAAPLDLARRETDIAALSDGWTWQIDTQLRFQMVLEGLGGEGALPSAPPLPGSRFTSFFQLRADADGARSEERRGGKECVSTCRSRRSTHHEK